MDLKLLKLHRVFSEIYCTGIKTLTCSWNIYFIVTKCQQHRMGLEIFIYIKQHNEMLQISGYMFRTLSLGYGWHG